jgi:hypothetical protein
VTRHSSRRTALARGPARYSCCSISLRGDSTGVRENNVALAPCRSGVPVTVIVIIANHSNIDRTTPCGRTGTQSQ